MIVDEMIQEFDDWIGYGGAGSGWTAARKLRLLNAAYRREVRRGKLEGHSSWFTKTQDFTWPASQVTATSTNTNMPKIAFERQLLMLEDVTDGDPGEPLVFTNYNRGEIFFKDNRTLQWGDAGPPSARTIRIHYLADAENLEDDNQEPELIPPDHHELIVMSAVTYARYGTAERSPPDWKEELMERRYDYWKFISLPRPLDNTNRVINRYNDDPGWII